MMDIVWLVWKMIEPKMIPMGKLGVTLPVSRVTCEGRVGIGVGFGWSVDVGRIVDRLRGRRMVGIVG
jgi:hypothetical protein